MGGGAATTFAAALVAVVAVWAGVASAAVYEVGDKTGWTIMGSPNYTAWAESKKFYVGDTIVFVYNKQFHNVNAVSKGAYKSCSTANAMATWSTGNDSVVLNTTGHHYFLCAVTGHCAAGQKVDVPVLDASAAPSESPAAAPSSGTKPSGGATAAPSPQPNAAPGALAGRAVAATVAASLLSLAAAVLA